MGKPVSISNSSAAANNVNDSNPHKGVTMTASSGSGDASLNTNGSNVNIGIKGNGNRTHVGHDNQNNQGVIVMGGSAIFPGPRESSDILNELRRAPAYYDSSLRKQAQQCMQDTRVAILNTIYEWVDSIDNPPIFWLHGPAGTGKSTIAHTVAKECRRRGRLGASFFFAHAHAECSDPNLFFSTIAYQLSKFDPDLQQHVISGVRAHPSPQDASIPTQFEEFILTPLRKLFNGPAREPIIVVVDAFDECNDAREASEILHLLAKIPSFPLWLKFLITSRPEPEIRSILHPDIHRISQSFDLLRDVDASSTDEDIKRFLRFHLDRIGKECALPSWPQEIDVKDLAQQAGGLFIFAYTAIQVISDKDAMDPESQLAMLKKIGSNGTPGFNLNVLYSRILQKAIPETATTMMQKRVITVIHAIVGLRAPLALCAVERLLELDCGAVRRALNRLRSIFIVPDNDEDTVQVIHPSFARYIADEGSCTEKRFFVCGRQLHSQLARNCLKQMKTHLKQNICNFKDFATVEAPIKDRASSNVDLQMLSEELKYSCENFAAHVFFADQKDGELRKMVAEWVNQYLPYWLEVLALIGSFHDALPSLRLLSNFCQVASASHVELPGTDRGELPRDDTSNFRVQMQTSKPVQSKSRRSFLRLLPKRLRARKVAHKQDPQFTKCPQLLTDAIRMVSESYDDIKRFPHQIYTSCLAFCPLDSLLFKQYSRLSAVRVLSGQRKNWRPLSHAFKDPNGDVISLTFSPDGTILASCSSVGKILLWNLETSESRLLACHTLRRRTAFTFSPDSKYIAADGHVYRVATGEQVLVPGICSAFSPDGLFIALGCDDGIIRLHDMQAPNLSLFAEFFGHGGMVTTLAFSDNKILASAFSDNTIRVWNCSSREMMKQIRCHGLSDHVTFSPNGTYVAALYKEFRTCIWIANIKTGKEKSIKLSGGFLNPKESTTIFSSSGNYTASCNNVAVDVVRWVEAPSTLVLSIATPSTPPIPSMPSRRSIRSILSMSSRRSIPTIPSISSTPSNGSIASIYRRPSIAFVLSTPPTPSTPSGTSRPSISFTPDEQSLLVGNEQGLIRSWRIPKHGRSVYRFDFECKAHFGAVQAITFSHSGKCFASASIDGSICVWDSTSVNLHEPHLTHTSVLFNQAVIFAPDGQTVAIGSGNTISKMDTTTGNSVFDMEAAPYSGLHRLIFSTNSKYLASNSPQKLLLWDTGSQFTLGKQTPLETTDFIVAHALSPDATYYVVWFSKRGLWVHNLRNGESRQMTHPNRRPHYVELRFSHDSKYLVSYLEEICVFDVEKGMQTDLNLPVRNRRVFNCAFSPCSQHIAIAHLSGLDVLEYLAKNSNMMEVHRQDGYSSVEFSPNAKYILAGAYGRPEEDQLDLFHADTMEILYTIKIWSRQMEQAMREFRKTGRLLNYPISQPSEYEHFPYLLDKDGWVITASSKRLCRLPVANRGDVYDVNGNRIVVVSPEGKVTLIQFGPNPICIPTPPVE